MPEADPGAGETPAPFLDIDEASSARKTIRLDKDVTRVGRRSDNDVQIVEAHVSKHHADILRRGGQFVVVDAGSKAGVFVNGRPVSERALADGDVITLGGAPTPALIFRLAEAPADTDSGTVVRSTLAGVPADRGLENLAKFLELSRVLGGQLPLDEILENVVDLATELTAAERGFLILGRPDGSLDFRVARGRDKRPLRGGNILVSETIVREVLAEGATRVISDVRQDDDLAGLKSVVALNLGSAVALPLRRFAVHDGGTTALGARGHVFGVLYLDSREPQSALTRSDHGLLETLARDASAVIENARLLRQAEENRRTEAEMERAREVQAALLPQSFWQNGFFEVSGKCVPSLRLGGDYLDQFRLDGDRCCFVMADVAGKGLPAALLAAALQGAMSAESASEQPLETMVGRINRAIVRLAPVGKFVTFFCCVLSPSGRLAYVNAGHTASIVISAGGEMRELSTGDMALGVRESNLYHEGVMELRKGDVVVLYTDGVTEAANGDEEFFEVSRLEQVLKQARHLPPGKIVEAILEAVEAFVGNLPPRDDITLMVVRYLGR